MRISCVYDKDKGLSRLIAETFAQACGGVAIEPHQYKGGPVALYGVQPATKAVWEAVKASGTDYYFIDNGYFSDRSLPYRFRSYRIVKNGLHYQGRAKPDWKRWRDLDLTIRPWRPGEHILICPPGEFWMRNTLNQSAGKWLIQTLEDVQRGTERPIRIRYKPRKRPFPKLQDDLENAHAIVTCLSSVIYWGLLHGVTGLFDGRHGAAMLGRCNVANLDDPEYPDGRELLFATLAGQQWRVDEFDQAWERLSEN